MTITRNDLIENLKTPPVPGTIAMLEQQGGSPEDLADAIFAAYAAWNSRQAPGQTGGR